MRLGHTGHIDGLRVVRDHALHELDIGDRVIRARRDLYFGAHSVVVVLREAGGWCGKESQKAQDCKTRENVHYKVGLGAVGAAGIQTGYASRLRAVVPRAGSQTRTM